MVPDIWSQQRIWVYFHFVNNIMPISFRPSLIRITKKKKKQTLLVYPNAWFHGITADVYGDLLKCYFDSVALDETRAWVF